MEIRVNNGSVEVTGYVNAVGRESSPLHDRDGYFTETIQPGAFAQALRENPNIPMLLNHDTARIIASGDALDLREDPVGLHVRAIITDQEVVDKAASGQLRGWSFGFVPLDQTFKDHADKIRHRDVHRMKLSEVSLLDNTRTPAYPATSVYTRDDGSEDAIELRFMDDESYIQVIADSEDAIPDTEPPDLSSYRAILDDLGMMD